MAIWFVLVLAVSHSSQDYRLPSRHKQLKGEGKAQLFIAHSKMTAQRRNVALVQLLSDVSAVTGEARPFLSKGSHSGSAPSRFDPSNEHNSSNDSSHSNDIPAKSIHNTSQSDSISNSNMSTEIKSAANPAPIAASQLNPHIFNLPDLENGLSNIDSATLRSLVEPIWDSLASLDAEELLCLDRVDQGGAHVQDGIYVRPIHEEILPPKHEYRNGSCVRYLHVAEIVGRYSIGIFVFPPHAIIPLHDHPDMCVLSRVLYGDLTKRSLDLEQETAVTRSSWLSTMFGRGSSSSRSNKKVPTNAKRAFHRETEYLQAPAVTMLFPLEGNLHEFTAGAQGAAVLDVLLPPYEGDDRECTFYSIHQDGVAHESNPRACWILPTGQPENFHCLSGEYRHLGRDDQDVLE